MRGFGPLFIIIGCYFIMNGFARIKNNKIRFASSHKSTNPRRNRRKAPGEFRDARNK